jgi:hypothetical protein
MHNDCQRICHYLPKIVNVTFRRSVCKKDAGDVLEADVTFTAAIRFEIRPRFVSPRGAFIARMIFRVCLEDVITMRDF